MEIIRSFVLFLGWPILFIGSLFLFYRTYRFYLAVSRNVWGKLILIMVIGWLLTMYSLGLVSTIFMLVSLKSGTLTVLPIFGVWFITMIMITRIVLRWNKEAVSVNKFNMQLQSLVDERTKDLSHEKQMAEAERNKLKMIIGSITDGVLAIDLDHRIIMGNEAIERITGFKLEDLIGERVIEKLEFFEEGKKLEQNELCPIREDGYEGITVQKEKIKLKGDHTERYITLIVSQITEGKAANLGCIMTFHDTTKEQDLEDMKLDFVSMAAHELRTPLTSIRGYALLLNDLIAQSITNEAKDYLNRLIVSSGMLSGLIENLLNVSRIERNTFTIERSPIEIVDIITTVVNTLAQQASTKRQTLNYSPPKEKFPLVMADSFRISQVVTNLIANAINYTQEGGTISVIVKKREDEIEVNVADNGQGIPADAVPNLFTKFFRVSGPLEVGSKGTGLGLYITKSIITMHKGKIWVESELGKSATFYFTLPIAKSADLETFKNENKNNKMVIQSQHGVIINKSRFQERIAKNNTE